MAYYLGIDGGGSKTTCAVGDESSLLTTVTSGPSNITRVGEVCARESLRSAIRAGCAAAKIDPRQVQRACIGVAGAGRGEIAGAVRRIVAELLPGEIKVTGDMQIALAAAFGADPGVIVIAGTGSIAYGRNAQGRTVRAGGWGFAISDEGSAHWIGRATVAGLLRAIDQGTADGKDAQDAAKGLPLFRELKARWQLQSLDEFVRAANSNADFAALFPAILAAADSGDAVAQRILAQAGAELAQLAGIVTRRLFPEESENLPLAMAGGVFRHSSGVYDSFCDAIRKCDTRLSVIADVIDPVTGALQLARRPALNAEVGTG